MQNSDAISLGILQGITEFLPVSSSGHLAVAQSMLRYRPDQYLLYDVIVHLGTLLVILWIYRSSLARYVSGGISAWQAPTGGSWWTRWWHETSIRELFWIAIATIPTGLIGVLFQKQLKAAFGSLSTITAMFVITGIVLWVTRWRQGGEIDAANLGWWRAILLGLAQGIAIMPGISRSGATIACALLLGMRREEAARFSFLLAIPAICGATILELRSSDFGNTSATALALGFVSAAISGYLALRFLIHIVRQGQISWFAVYLWILAATLSLKMLLSA
jgi:undecaprenyl-diphosphatase